LHPFLPDERQPLWGSSCSLHDYPSSVVFGIHPSLPLTAMEQPASFWLRCPAYEQTKGAGEPTGTAISWESQNIGSERRRSRVTPARVRLWKLNRERHLGSAGSVPVNLARRLRFNSRWESGFSWSNPDRPHRHRALSQPDWSARP